MAFHLDGLTRGELAKAIYHDHVARTISGDNSVPPGQRHVPYEALPEEAQESSRARADDVAAKVEMIGATIVPLSELGPGEFSFTSGELERLSRHEHARWMTGKLRADWRLGPAVDAAARTHPCLVSYDQLPEAEKEKDRQVVERIPLLLRAVGLGISRSE